MAEKQATRSSRADDRMAEARLLLEHSRDIILVLSPEGRVLDANEAAIAAYGYDRKELLTKTISELRLEPHAAGVPTPEEAIQTGGVTFEVMHRRKDGSPVALEMTLRPAARSRNSPVLIAMGREITARKRADDLARFQQEAMELLASSLDYKSTLTSVAQLAVPAIADWCGIDLVRDDGTLEHLVVSHTDPEVLNEALAMRERVEADRLPGEGVMSVIRSGQPIFVPHISEEMYSPLVDRPELLEYVRNLKLKSAMTLPLTARGRTFGAISLVTSGSGRTYDEDDLARATELAKRAATAIDSALLHRDLQEAEERYRSLVERMPAVTYIQKMTAVPEIIYVSPQVEAVLGIPAEVYLDSAARQALVHPEDMPGLLAKWAELREGGQPAPVEYRIMGGDGRYRWIRNDGVVVSGRPGEPDFVHGVVMDITERKRQEENEAFLGDATELLVTSLDYEARLRRLVALLVPRLADFCAIELLDEEGQLEQVAAAHVDPGMLVRAQAVRAGADMRQQEQGAQRVVQTRAPELRQDGLAAIPSAIETQGRAMSAALGFTSSLCVPLVARGRILGALAMATAGTRPGFDAEATALALELATRAALAIDNARLHAEAQAAEAKFRTLVEQVPAVTYTVGLDERATLLYVSPQVEALAGYSAQEVLSDQDIRNRQVYAEDAERLLPRRAAAVAAGQPLNEDYRLIRKDGGLVWVHDESVLVRDAEGRPVARQGVMIDISAQKRAEETQRILAEVSAVLTSSLDHEEILGRVAGLIVPTLADWCLVHLVEEDGGRRLAAVAHADPSKAEVAGRLRHFEPRRGWQRTLDHVISRGKAVLVERFEAPPPEQLTAEGAALVRDLDPASAIFVPMAARGPVRGALTLFTAESKRIYTAADLELAEELGRRTALAIDNALLHGETERARLALQERWMALPEAAAVLLPNGQLFLSGRAAEMFHLSTMTPHGLDRLPLFRSSGLPWAFFAEANPMEIVRRTGEPLFALEYQVRTTAGVEPVVANIGPLDLGEGGRGAIMLFQPIRQLRVLEETQTDFMRVLAHELRHPLATANLALELLEGEGVPAEVGRYLETAKQEIAAMSSLISELTDIIGAGQDLLAIEPERADLRTVVEEHRTALEAMARGRELALELTREECPVMIDQRRLLSVISNLVGSAGRQAPEGTTVRLVVERQDDEVRLSVADEGPPLAPQVRNKLFERYYRGDSHGSLGLALFLARRILEYHDGSISYDESLGFSLSLPIRAQG